MSVPAPGAAGSHPDLTPRTDTQRAGSPPQPDAAAGHGAQAAIDEVCDAFHGFMKALHSLDRRPGWGELDLTMSQLKTIMLLVDTGGLNGREIAERLGIGPSAVTALVDRLVQRGYARREEDRTDRRISWARPTQQAIDLFERLNATHRERLAEVLQALTPDQLLLVETAISTLELAATRQAGLTPRSRKSPA